MCILCAIGEAIDHKVNGPKEEVTIGRVSEETRLQYLAYKERRKALTKEIEDKREELQQLMNEFNAPREKEIDQMHEVAWGRIAQELGLDRDKEDLTINPNTGVVKKKITTKRDPQPGHTH